MIAVARDRPDRRRAARPPHADPHGRARPRRARHRGAAARRRPRARVRLLARTCSSNGFDFAAGQGWHDLFFALPLAMLAYTGLETVANLAEETREPGRVLPRSLFSSIGLVVIMTVLIAIVGAVGVPGRGRLDRPRRRLAAGADRRHRDRVRRAPAGGDGRHPARRRRAVGRAHPLRGRDDGDHRLHAARPLDGRARDAAARVRPARAALARLARGARRHRRGRDRDRRRHGDLRQGRPRLPRQRLLVRGAVRLHRGAARRDPAPSQGAGSRAPVPGQAGGA